MTSTAHNRAIRNCLIGSALIILAALGAIGKFTGDELIISGAALPPDAKEYVITAFNINQHGVISAEADQTDVQPTLSRQPLFPMVLSIAMSTLPQLGDSDLLCLASNGDNCSQIRLQIKRLYAFVMLLLGISTFYVAMQITKNIWLASIASILVFSSQGLWLRVQQILSEPIAALCLLWASYFLCRTIVSDRIRYYLFAGLAIGLLYLTKKVFIFLFLGLAFIWVLYAVLPRNRTNLLANLKKGSAFTLGFLILVTPWMIRNTINLDDTLQTNSRAANVISIRAKYNLMSTKEMGISFIYWGSGAGKKLTEKLFDYDDYRMLDRKFDEGYFRGDPEGALTNLSEKYGQGTSAYHKAAMDLALSNIASNPLRHIIMTVPFFYRGMFFETGFDLGRPFLFKINLESSLFMGPLLLLGLFGLFIKSIKLKSCPELLFTIPAVFSVAIHSVMSHNLPRYSEPIIPVAVIATLIVAATLFREKTRKPAC